MAEVAKERREELEALEESISKPNRGIVATQDFVDPDTLYEELIARIRKYHPNTDISMVNQAYHLAKDAHEGQARKSGEPYIIHPLCVAIILADLEMDKETIVAGILHDVVEDTVFTREEITEEFSAEVASLVDGVTKLGQLSYDADKVEVQAENLRKMFLAMAKDIRVIIIKLADRLHNMRTLKYMKPEKQLEKSRETMEIYSPLADRLGIAKVKIELDDLALKYLEPDAYYDLVEKIALRRKERDDYIQGLVDEVRRHIEDAGIKAEIEGRAKHFFSIYKKMVNQNKTLDQIYDLFAIRIIVSDIKNCYAALGVMHENYTPIPGRFKDYIAMPKPNMYQSIHTTLIGPTGTPFEIQIRTYEMHRTSEYGIAAHWKYKESGEGSTLNQEEEKLSWLRQILEWQQDMSDNREFVSLLKSDLNLFSDMVFCFTPTGEVKNLPMGSTPIDFAYSIHSAVGNKMVGAKVNGRLVPIDYTIQNGDRIDIITSQNSRGPSRDWLALVKSTQAKNKINQWFRSTFKEENIGKGRELIAESAKAKGINLGDINKSKYQEKVIRKYGFHDWDAVLAAVGQGSLKEGAVVNRMYVAYLKEHPLEVTDDDILKQTGIKKEYSRPQPIPHSKSGIVVQGLYDVSVRFSKCCNPVPGDEIIGFVTRGRGVTIHRTDCINIINLPDADKARLIEAEWQPEFLEQKNSSIFAAEIHIYGNNRTGLLVDISRIFTERNIDIQSMNSRTNRQGVATIDVSFGVKSREQLGHLIDCIRKVESVIDIERATG
ncbi:MAG: bifunctional (p)ppGpp synthetase/guanosine-3',5'-bis(diphosphate) 3'-pyrophosphohydrolase [Lachnospiraceae bacterium]|nr:bifunctional (p)ppGpp synthetase/guanosine-3',5'-bis(diphosphate) 3'-pyrophosphohydrolase [Lachnospiraceae bacterium]